MAAAGRSALGGPRPNPSDDDPRLGSPPGKGKPVALADITNTGRRDATSSLADVVKENAKLVQLLNERTRTIERSRVEVQKLHFELQASRQQNLQLAQANSQMLAELNMGKDRLKALQHELSCTAALLKVKESELEKKNKAANQRRKEVNSLDVMKVIPSKVAAGVAHRIDGSVTSATEHHLVGSRFAVPSTTCCQEPPNDKATMRGRNKRKYESSECIKDTNVMHDHYKPHLQPVISLDHEDPRRPVRRSTRLNPGSCEVTEVSCSKLPEDDVVPSAPSFILQKQHGSTTGKDMRKSLQNECSHEGVMASGFKKMDINEPLCQDEKRKSQRRKSARLDSELFENTKSTSETLHEDVISPLPHSSSNASMERTINQKPTDGCSSTKAIEGQVAGRRSLRQAAERVVTYKEIPLNVKMRRP